MPGTAWADPKTFGSDSLIIPMDIDYQDMGMFEAYGLVYALLQGGVTIHWTIAPNKDHNGVDFTASAVDIVSAASVTDHGYRGGPFVIDAADADAALAIIEDFNTNVADEGVAVHRATASFDTDVSRTMIVAPTIAMMADGNQKIARAYMMAAHIPDSTGDYGWPDASPDMLDPGEIMGPTDTNHTDGALFDDEGTPVYCQFMSMHWGVKDAEENPEVVAEMRYFLQSPTHLYAQCQAVNAFENLEMWGHFLTTTGFEIGDQPNAWDFYNADQPYVQIDGDFESVGGSEPAYTLPVGGAYSGGESVVMITEAGTPVGTNDVWMTGYLDGACEPTAEICALPDGEGKISYLGGHDYGVDLPISANPQSNGTRLFLDSLFEAQCATEEGFPQLTITKSGPSTTDTASVEYTISVHNDGPGVALDAVLTDELPAGANFISATGTTTATGATVVWDLGNLDSNETQDVTVVVQFADYGTFENDAELDFRVGTNLFSDTSNIVETVYGPDGGTTTDTASTSDSATTTDTATTGAETSSGSTGTATGTDTGSSSGGETAGETSGAEAGIDESGGSSGCSCDTSDEEGPAPLGLLAFVVGGLAWRRRRGGDAPTA